MNLIDQIGHQLTLKSTPKRIISLVPSQTELLYDLGLDDRVVGITKFCIHPKDWFETKFRVGGTKNINVDKIAYLKPDLIIANKEENTQEEIEYLQKHYPVYTSDISDLSESIEMITDIGRITEKIDECSVIVENIKSQFDRLSLSSLKKHLTLYFIWREPYMTISQNTFINDMMERCGFQNAVSDSIDYPVLNQHQISGLNPELIFLSSEPYPFKEKHIKEFQLICPNAKIILVDGEYFSWYGSRLQQAVDYFIALMDKIP